jgi:hypothetical protein
MPPPVEPLTEMKGLQLAVFAVVAVPQVPTPLSKSDGLREANKVTPLSIQKVTPDFSVSAPLINALASVLEATSFTAWPLGQLSIAL